MDENLFELFCCLQCPYCNGQYDDTERVPVCEESGPERQGDHWTRRWAWYHHVSGGHRVMCRANQARSKWTVAQQQLQQQATGVTVTAEG